MSRWTCCSKTGEPSVSEPRPAGADRVGADERLHARAACSSARSRARGRRATRRSTRRSRRSRPRASSASARPALAAARPTRSRTDGVARCSDGCGRRRRSTVRTRRSCGSSCSGSSTRGRRSPSSTTRSPPPRAAHRLRGDARRGRTSAPQARNGTGRQCVLRRARARMGDPLRARVHRRGRPQTRDRIERGAKPGTTRASGTVEF